METETDQGEKMRRVSVIGAGTIGASWAAYFLARGFEVAGYDPAPNGEAFARQFIDTAWPTLEKLEVVQASANRKRFEFFKDPAAAVKGAEFIQESGPEREDLKIELFATLDTALPPDIVIATSSSGLLISRISAKTSPGAIAKAMQFYRDIGKYPIHIKKEVKGHVANRLQVALWREAVHLVAEGVVSVSDADAAIAYGPGLRWALMGPHLTFHMAGGEGGMKHFMDHLGGPIQGWMDDLGQTRLTPDVQKKIIDGVAEEAAGRNMADLQRWRDRKLIDILKVSGEP